MGFIITHYWPPQLEDDTDMIILINHRLLGQ